jgi:two-component system, NtrC family, response regulator HydG
MNILAKYNWPGNVRELRNIIERAVILCHGNKIEPADLPAHIVHPSGDEPVITIAFGTGLKIVEKTIILQTLQRHNNNKTLTAKELGISLKTLHNKLQEYKSGPFEEN